MRQASTLVCASVKIQLCFYSECGEKYFFSCGKTIARVVWSLVNGDWLRDSVWEVCTSAARTYESRCCPRQQSGRLRDLEIVVVSVRATQMQSSRFWTFGAGSVCLTGWLVGWLVEGFESLSKVRVHTGSKRVKYACRTELVAWIGRWD
jgi:hypothetical protein